MPAIADLAKMRVSVACVKPAGVLAREHEGCSSLPKSAKHEELTAAVDDERGDTRRRAAACRRRGRSEAVESLMKAMSR